MSSANEVNWLPRAAIVEGCVEYGLIREEAGDRLREEGRAVLEVSRLLNRADIRRDERREETEVRSISFEGKGRNENRQRLVRE